MAEITISLFGKPSWELNLEGQDLSKSLIQEISELADGHKLHLKQVARDLKILLRNGWQGGGGLYDISLWKPITKAECKKELIKFKIETAHDVTHSFASDVPKMEIEKLCYEGGNHHQQVHEEGDMTLIRTRKCRNPKYFRYNVYLPNDGIPLFDEPVKDINKAKKMIKLIREEGFERYMTDAPLEEVIQ